MQKVLDPTTPGTRGTWRPKQALPHRVREFGRWPNTDSWRVGDVLLFSEVKPSSLGRKIRNLQESVGFAPEHARWTHAALYVGNDYMCEATPPRVRYCGIDDRIGSHFIRVLRDPTLTGEQAAQFAISTVAQVRKPYSYAVILWLAIRAAGFRRTSLYPRWVLGHTCSMLISLTYAYAGQRIIGDVMPEAVTPATVAIAAFAMSTSSGERLAANSIEVSDDISAATMLASTGASCRRRLAFLRLPHADSNGHCRNTANVRHDVSVGVVPTATEGTTRITG
jgi:hypothetical protein